MLSVWCVLNGTKYTADEAHILRNQVSRHLSQPFDFWCLSDRHIDGIDCLIPEEKWPGWWAKLGLFRYSTGKTLYLDLDCVVTGELGGLLSEKLSMAANWANSGHGGCQSSVMAWDGDYSWLADAFDPAKLHPPINGNCGAYGDQHLWGDQEFITDLLGNPGTGMIVPMKGVYSYKYHCREQGKPPTDSRVVCFHGEPKPSQVSESWVKAARSSTATRP